MDKRKNISVAYIIKTEQNACLYIEHEFKKDARPTSDMPDCYFGRFVDHPIKNHILKGDTIDYFEVPQECWNKNKIINGYIINREGLQVHIELYMTIPNIK
jgi:hypothetical protein